MRKNKLYIFRVQNYLNQTDMAKRCGISTPMYNMIENNNRKGSEEFWQRLQREFNISDAKLWTLREE